MSLTNVNAHVGIIYYVLFQTGSQAGALDGNPVGALDGRCYQHKCGDNSSVLVRIGSSDWLPCPPGDSINVCTIAVFMYFHTHH